MEGRIVRLVIDEAHKIFTELEFRGSFAKLLTLAAYEVQKLYLTATLPPELEDEFLKDSGMPRTLLFIRAPTTRPNIRYHVLYLDHQIEHANKVSVRLAKHLQATTFGDNSRGIIFCTDIRSVEAVGPQFDNCMSHSKMESTERNHCQEAWYQGYKTWMVATSGFMNGIDHPDVRAVLFIGIPFGAINIEQGSGRAGRTGQPVNIFLLDSLHINFIPCLLKPDRECRNAALEFASGHIECRRYTMTQAMDGVGVRCRDLPNAELCDKCDGDTELLRAAQEIANRQPTPEPVAALAITASEQWEDVTLMHVDNDYATPGDSGGGGVGEAVEATLADPVESVQPTPQMAAAARNLPARTLDLPSTTKPSMAVQIDSAVHRKKMKNKKAKVLEMTAMIRYLYHKCAVCWARFGHNNVIMMHHKHFISCVGVGKPLLREGYHWIKYKQEIKQTFAPYSYCHHCGMPQEPNMPVNHPRFQTGKKTQCPLHDMVFVLGWFVWVEKEVFKDACKSFPTLRENMSVEEFTHWSTLEEDNDKFYNTLELVLWLWNHLGGAKYPM
jgi:Helicase conserved C-terminal domain